MLRRLILLITLNAFLYVLPGNTVASLAKGDVLGSINGHEYTVEDFTRWWELWKEKDTPFPDSPAPFVHWHLLVQDAESMELYREKSFQHKVDVFRKARSLMLLKNEIIDAAIEISDEEVKKFYEENYLPRWYLAILNFQMNEDALHAIFLLQESGRTLDAVLTDLSHAGVIYRMEKKWFDAASVPPEFQKDLERSSPGTVVKPESLDESNIFLYLLETKENDFSLIEKKRNKIENLIRKDKSRRLTENLVDDLKEKYQVRVDDALFMEINPEENAVGIADKILIQSNKVNVTAGEFWREFRSYSQKRINKETDPEFTRNSMRWVLNSLIASSVVSWEALDRHYEDQEIFKWQYRFYRQNRLIKELEKMYLPDSPEIDEGAIQQYYEENPMEFTLPAKVQYDLIRGDEEQIKKVWIETISGTDLTASVVKYGIKNVFREDVESAKLPAAIRPYVVKLSKNEVSSPFNYEGGAAIVRLLHRIPEKMLPLHHVKQRISEKLMQKKIHDHTMDYLNRLKAKSDIKINQAVWKEILTAYK